MYAVSEEDVLKTVVFAEGQEGSFELLLRFRPRGPPSGQRCWIELIQHAKEILFRHSGQMEIHFGVLNIGMS